MRMQKIKSIILFSVTLFFLMPFFGFSVGKMKGPNNSSSPLIFQSHPKNTARSFPTFLFTGFIRSFQLLISPLDGPRSPSYPTGSAYGFQAVKKYGWITGSILAADRLFHETDYFEGNFIEVNGKKRYYDPVEFNTYWWDDDALELIR